MKHTLSTIGVRIRAGVTRLSEPSCLTMLQTSRSTSAVTATTFRHALHGATNVGDNYSNANILHNTHNASQHLQKIFPQKHSMCDHHKRNEI